PSAISPRPASAPARGSGGAWGPLAALAVPALAALLAYSPLLGAGLTGEDLGLLRGAADAPIPSFFAPGGGAANNPYWRPVWHLLNRVIVGLTGGDPLECARRAHVASVLLHSLNAALVAGLGLSLLRNPLASGLAGLLFALSPGPVAAVAWFAAANKLLTVTFALLAVMTALWYGESGRFGDCAAIVGYAVLALGTSELSLGLLPVLGLAVLRFAPDLRTGAVRAVTILAPLLVASVAYAFFLQPAGALRRGLPAGEVAGAIAAGVRGEAGYLSLLLGGPNVPSPGLGTALLTALLACFLAGRTARFLAAWTLLAPFPTVLTNVAPFHSALAAVPISLLLAWPSLLLRSAALRLPAAALQGILLAAAWFPGVRAEIRGWVGHSREALDFAREVKRAAPDLAGGDTLRLANVPPSFDAAILGLLGDVAAMAKIEFQRIEFLATDSACFLPADFAWPSARGARIFEFSRLADGRTRAEAAQEACAGKTPVGGARVFYRVERAAGFDEAVAACRRLPDPQEVLVLEGDLPAVGGEGGSEAAEVLGTEFLADRVVVRLRVRARAPGVVALFDPRLAFAPEPRERLLLRDAFVRLPRGHAEVRGRRGALLPANGLYRGAAVAEGESEVLLVFTL
ncbi:MAG: hypothetical protein ACREIU_04565, partial [Planctomycetota bacterium]